MAPQLKLPGKQAKCIEGSFWTQLEYTEWPFWTKLECTEGPFWNIYRIVWAKGSFCLDNIGWSDVMFKS